VRFWRIKDQEKGYWFILMGGYIKVIGIIIWEMEKGIKNLVMDHFIKEDMSMENLKDVVDINGLMDKYIKDNGKMELNMDQVFGEVQKEILI